ncbi:MAG: class I SAM-dependent methyltransferase [Polyangiales bacterium]
MKDMWEERYAADDYAYGEEPNAFFKACLDRLPTPGRLLLPAEGEGRNAVYAATRGWRVDAFDFSAAGREKALHLAERHGVHIHYEVADYETAHIEPRAYDAVALIFAHKPERLRRAVHRKLASALKPGGHLFLEAYSKEQLAYGTGGPPNEQLLYTLDDLREDFSDLDILELEQVEAEIHEGLYHTGLASVVRLIARQADRST